MLCLFLSRHATCEGGDNGFEGEEDDCGVKSDVSEPEVNTILRTLFDTVQNRRTGNPPTAIRVVLKHMMGTENPLRNYGYNAANRHRFGCSYPCLRAADFLRFRLVSRECSSLSVPPSSHRSMKDSVCLSFLY